MKTLRDGRKNFRGLTVMVYVDGRWRQVKVVTHIRGDRWLVAGATLPPRCRHPFGGRRAIVSQSEMWFIDDWS